MELVKIGAISVTGNLAVDSETGKESEMVKRIEDLCDEAHCYYTLNIRETFDGYDIDVYVECPFRKAESEVEK